MTFGCLIDFPPFILATLKWASARPKCAIQSFPVVHRKCIAAAAAADRAESVSSVSSILAFLSPLVTRVSVAPHCLNLTIRLCIHPLASIHLLSADNRAASDQEACHGQEESKLEDKKSTVTTCVYVRRCFAQQNMSDPSLQVKMENPLRTAPSLNIHKAPSLTLRPVH